ncbi:hypothetical protein EV182_000516 [Spiromyces aspiralis]|uniref:Uncharacterized protein n=1 Tax=Spiromyces aspiralis TaxID=68401 RepID=A0ACC1HWZ7_9FUNG|nr:hypothetical protein EV182_000516 [Spiromyces aspiralis]
MKLLTRLVTLALVLCVLAALAESIPYLKKRANDNSQYSQSGNKNQPASSSSPTNGEQNSKRNDSSSQGNDNSSSSGGDVPNGAGNGKCEFPWPDPNNGDHVVPITIDQGNAGWAMSPDQSCKPNSWCPYACAPGYYSTQWDPNAKAPNGPGSMNGGLYCDANGKLSKPSPGRPFCQMGLGNARIQNTLGQPVSACQTVYPGNEAMIIPTVVQPSGSSVINVVPKDYWCQTSAQYYVNLADSTDAQCIWGTSDKPVGNWGPYIFGAGQGKDGNTYVSVQYNPLYIEKGFDPKNVYNVAIECEGEGCNFPAGGKCQCEKGTCSVANGCTVTLTGSAKAVFKLY